MLKKKNYILSTISLFTIIYSRLRSTQKDNNTLCDRNLVSNTIVDKGLENLKGGGGKRDGKNTGESKWSADDINEFRTDTFGC